MIPQGRHTQCEPCRGQRRGVHIRKDRGLRSLGRPGAAAAAQQAEHTTLVAAMPDLPEPVAGAAAIPQRTPPPPVRIKVERTTECIFDRPVTQTAMAPRTDERSDLGIWLAVLGGFVTAVAVFLLSTI